MLNSESGERTGAMIPRGRGTIALISDLRDLILIDGPIASVALSSPSALDDAAARLDTRWHNARRQLERAEFPDAELGRMDDTVADLHHNDGASVVLLQAPGEPGAAPRMPHRCDADQRRCRPSAQARRLETLRVRAVDVRCATSCRVVQLRHRARSENSTRRTRWGRRSR